jgi:DNA-directed RNA polymerase subunit RPC12/RpoP
VKKDINEGPKPYECMACGLEQLTVTNHFGQIYGKCPECGNRRHRYTGEIPPGAIVPEPWTDEMIIQSDAVMERIRRIGKQITKEELNRVTVEQWNSNLLDDFIFFIEEEVEENDIDLSIIALHDLKKKYLESIKPNEDV